MSNYNQLRLKYTNGSQSAITLTSDTISYGEYQYQDIVAVEVPEIVTTIDEYAFCDNSLTSITLNEGLQAIGNQAFQHGTYSTITIPSTVEYIGWNAFNISFEQDIELAGNLTVACLATTPPQLSDEEDITFGKSDMITAIYVPSGSVAAYQEAEVWSKYASKIQAMPPKQEWFTKGYIGDELVERLYLGSELVWEPEQPGPSPVYSAMPLTFEILSGGSIDFRKLDSRMTSLEIEYKVNNGEWTTHSSSSELRLEDLAAGDKVQFRGDNPTYATSTINYWHTFGYSDAEFKAEGNIMSLINSQDYSNLQTLASSFTFAGLFMGCTGLTDASNLILPATSLKTSCYRYMFKDCTSLTTAPALPATTLATSCYVEMFRGCTNLATAPALPATTLAQYCYQNMFYRCTSLTAAPELQATNLHNGCYQGMFQNCISLNTAHALPAEILQNYCYQNMFRGCTSLTTAPELPAPSLRNNCYQNMFSGCTNLNYIKCLAANITASNCTTGWVADVAPTGTFVKNVIITSWPTGASGIPQGWTVQDALE